MSRQRIHTLVSLMVLCLALARPHPLVAGPGDSVGDAADPAAPAAEAPAIAPTPAQIGHFAGRFTAYLGATSALAFGGGVVKDIERGNEGTVPLWTDASEFGVVYYSRSSEGRPRLTETPGRHLSLGWGLSDHWGVSLDVDDRRYVVHGQSASYMPFLLYSTFARQSVPSSAYPQLAASMNQYYVAYRDSFNILRLVTVGGSLEYHPRSRSAFDPFLSVGYHQGREMMAMSRADRFHAGVGLRYFYFDHFFVSGGLSVQHYAIQKTRNGGGMERPPVDGSLNEVRAEVGLGVALPQITLPEPSLRNAPRHEDPVELRRVVEDLKGERDFELQLRDGRIAVILPNDAVFPSGSDEMAPGGKRVIQRLSQILSRTRKTLFTVEGHTDDEPVRQGGRYESNQALSEIRARKIRTLMVESGMQLERLHIRGYGATRPRHPNDSAASRALNRRIEIIADESIERYPELVPLLRKEQ